MIKSNTSHIGFEATECRMGHSGGPGLRRPSVAALQGDHGQGDAAVEYTAELRAKPVLNFPSCREDGDYRYLEQVKPALSTSHESSFVSCRFVFLQFPSTCPSVPSASVGVWNAPVRGATCKDRVYAQGAYGARRKLHTAERCSLRSFDCRVLLHCRFRTSCSRPTPTRPRRCAEMARRARGVASPRCAQVRAWAWAWAWACMYTRPAYPGMMPAYR